MYISFVLYIHFFTSLDEMSYSLQTFEYPLYIVGEGTSSNDNIGEKVELLYLNLYYIYPKYWDA